MLLGLDLIPIKPLFNASEIIMRIAKDGIRSIVRIGYDGKVHKTFRGTDKQQRFENEIQVLKELEARGCEYVPRVISFDCETLTLVTTNCGTPVQDMPKARCEQIFGDLKNHFGIIHDDAFARNITYDQHRGRFCIIDFELARIIGEPVEITPGASFSWSGMTKSGVRKPQNEDSLAVFSSEGEWSSMDLNQKLKSNADTNLIFVVSDGMGGHSGGALASNLVVSELHRYIPAMLGPSNEAAAPSALMESAVHSLHANVLRTSQGRPSVSDMGATVVCGWFCKNQLHFGHVGDSRLYRFRNGKLKQLTKDHSFVGKLMQKGKLNEREARLHPRRNVLTQAIGAGCQFIHPEVGSHNVEAGDWYMICSDGIIDGLWDNHIEQEFLMAEVANSSAKKLAKTMLNRAYEAAGRDDTTLFVIRVDS